MTDQLPPKDLLDAAKVVLPRAYCKYSNFKVACALRVSDGSIFVGCNVENASYTPTICAEGVAIGAMVAAGHLDITEALVLVETDKPASPCGVCRQRLVEMAKGDVLVHMCTSAGLHDVKTVAELLPFAYEFEPDD